MTLSKISRVSRGYQPEGRKRANGTDLFGFAVKLAGTAISAVTLLSVVVTMVGNGSPCALAADAPAAPKGAPAKKPAKNYNSKECNAYLSRLNVKLDDNWLLMDGRNVVTITAILNQDGSTGEVSVKSSSGNKEAENAANEAFVKAQPFESLPTSAGTTAQLVAVFDSFADPHGENNRNIKLSLGPAPGVQQAPAN